MSTDAVHIEPVIRIATRKGRRIFLLLGSLAFVLVTGLMIWFGGQALLTESLTQIRTWLVFTIGLIGLVFFGAITIGVIKNQLGSKGDTGLILSSAGLTDQTQIVGPLSLMPWSMISQYDVVAYQRQLFLLLQLRDVETYLKIIGSSRIMRWGFKANSKIFGRPVHAITLKHLQNSPEEIVGAMYQVTNLPPGPRVVSAGEAE